MLITHRLRMSELTWGMRNSRSRLATWMDVALEAAPSTPITFVCLRALAVALLSRPAHSYIESSMLVSEPVCVCVGNDQCKPHYIR